MSNKIYGVLESALVVFTKESRIIFQIIICPIVVIGVIANFAVLWKIYFSTGGKKSILKPLYRSALLSFAFSDILLLSTSSANTLSILQSGNLLWKLTDWSCSLIPFLQTVAILVGSLTLAGVAIDRRYIAMKPKYATIKGPKWLYAICFVISIWLVAIGASYPILQFYKTERIIVLSEETHTSYEGKLCVTFNINKAAYAYTGLFVTIFLPLATVFVLLHVLLALNISQRKCLMGKSQISTNQDSLSITPSTASTTANPPRKICSKKLPPPAHDQRKKRTLKIILILIIVFTVCRLPLWIFLLVKLYVRLEGNFWRYLQTFFTTLSFLNAAVDPFLYAFLNETLSLVSSICSWRKGNLEITSIIETNDNRNANLTDRSIVIKIPRSPYLTEM